MSLFQTSVRNKYLKTLDETKVEKAYKKYSKYFLDLKIQANIRDAKEEQFQEGFLRELFVNVFNYTLNPNKGYNLTTELKNEKNSKKADGAILKEGNALAVIELKGTNTKDLEKIRQQAFDYMANQTGCEYVITSNFEKLRFYIDKSVEHEEFDLFSLNKDRFTLLYLCIEKDNLLAGIPKKIKEASVLQEENITKKLYSDYSLFKRELYRDLVKKNRGDKILKEMMEKDFKKYLFKRSQKLIDRFLFIFFAEDRGLLPPNLISKINSEWKDLQDKRVEQSLYERYKLYFNDLDKGNEKQGIYAYNGGLFAQDPVLDRLEISNELLYMHTQVLTAYNFLTDVDVNVLGHIFEHSLNEIESINAEIEGIDFDKQKTKRKKDGVFYTPKYITKYIVENTVGKLCKEKQEELEVFDEEYYKGRKAYTKAETKTLHDNLKTYREWLLQITICDPACGSGAFLNEALGFLIKEHKHIDELEASLLGGIVFSNVETQILENNIFGVDINEESVEIAKLSLWLRTAQKGRKLNSLNCNIKCGNSLIDDPKVAGDKAFKWEEEFKGVFEKGGFDVVVGNPPYVRRTELPDLQKAFYNDGYYSAYKQYDLYVLFNELAFTKTKRGSLIGFIQPNKFLSAEYGYKICNYIIANGVVLSIYDVSLDKVFDDASVYPYIFIYRKLNNDVNIQERAVNLISECNRMGLVGFDSILGTEKVVEKLKESGVKIGEISSKIKRGVPNSKILFDENGEFFGVKSTLLSSRYCLPKSKVKFNYISNIDRENKVDEFAQSLILLPRTTLRIRAIQHDLKSHILDRVYYFGILDKNFFIEYVLNVLNRNITTYLYDIEYGTTKIGGGYIDLKGSQIKNFLIPNATLREQKEICRIGKILSSQIKFFLTTDDKFLSYLQSQINIDRLSKKLQNWHTLEFSAFISEINKAIKKSEGTKLTKSDEMEWMELFETKKAEVLKIKAEIDQTDKEIDAMVYELYGLTEEEIKIVERSSH